MSHVNIISNRLPISISKEIDGLKITESIGGLATGLKPYHEKTGGKWFGWPGLFLEELLPAEQKGLQKDLDKMRFKPLFLSESEIEGYYEGFANKTLWPLFHYFPQYVEYNNDYWDMYCRVNQKFCNIVVDNYDDKDII